MITLGSTLVFLKIYTAYPQQTFLYLNLDLCSSTLFFRCSGVTPAGDQNMFKSDENDLERQHSQQFEFQFHFLVLFINSDKVPIAS